MCLAVIRLWSQENEAQRSVLQSPRSFVLSKSKTTNRRSELSSYEKLQTEARTRSRSCRSFTLIVNRSPAHPLCKVTAPYPERLRVPVQVSIVSKPRLSGLGTMQAASQSTVDTVYSADAIEYCPVAPYIFACGTYQIEKDESSAQTGEDGVVSEPTVTRFGRCLLYETDADGTNWWVILWYTMRETMLKGMWKHRRELQRFDGPAILDMKWSAVVPSPSPVSLVSLTRLAGQVNSKIER